MDENSCWTWLLGGLGGIVRLHEQAAMQGLKAYRERADELDEFVERLHDVAEKLRANPQ